MERNLAKEVAARINCTVVQEIGIEESPIRGGAAVRGVTCDVDGHRLDIFEVGGADLARLDELFVARGEDGCGWIVVADQWFITGDSRALLDDIAGDLGGVVQRPAPVSPVASYDIPGCGP